MSAPVFDAPAPVARATSDWERDQYKRPKIKPPVGETWTNAQGGAQAWRPYTRVTTFAGALEDGQGLIDWKAAQALLGASRRPDYLMGVAACHSWDQDRDTLRDLVGKCADAAGESASIIGTALHSFTERLDRGEPVGHVPPAFAAHLERYAELVTPLRFTHYEVRTVCDALETAGTPDRYGYCTLPDPDGVVAPLRVIDTKSGKLGPGVPKMSTQLAIYAHSELYDPETGERTPLEVDTRWGLIVHLPAKATAEEIRAGAGGLYWLRLDHGWAGAAMAGPVRQWRKVRPDQLLVPVAAAPPATAAPAPAPAGDDPADAIRAAVHTSDLAGLWQAGGADWGPELQQLAAARYAELEAVERLRAPRAALAAALEHAADWPTLQGLWDEHAGSELWTDEHTAAATARHLALQAAPAA